MKSAILRRRLTPYYQKLVVPAIAVFICSLCVCIKPVGRISHSYGFLALTINTLFFFPGSTIGAQIELSVLGLFGCLFGLGWSSLFIRISNVLNTEGEESAKSRVLGAFALAIMAFVAGYIRSHSPRLTIGSRLALFHSIWLLTSEMGRTDLPSIVVLDLLYPTLFAAGASLIARLLFPTTSVGKFLDLTQQAFRTSERLLLASVDDFFVESPDPSRISTLRSLFINQTRSLPQAYDSCLYEVSYNTFAPHRLLPFVTLVRRLKMDVAAGSSYSSSRPSAVRRQSEATLGAEVEHRRNFEPPTRAFVQALVAAYAVIHSVLEGRSDDGMQGARERLDAAVETFKDAMDVKLEEAVQRWEGKETESKMLDEELLQISLFAYTLRAISKTLYDALASAKDLNHHTQTKAKLRCPQLSRKWLGENSVTAPWDESARQREREPDAETISDGEHLRTEIETSVAEAFLGVGADRVHVGDARFGSPRWFGFLARRIWDSEAAIRCRMTLARFESYFRERRQHFQYAFKISLGVTLLSVPAFLHPTAAGRIWWLAARGAWIPISYVYVLETVAGQTWKIGFYRALGTVLGSVLGCIMWAISRGNPFALVVLTTCYGFLTAYIMLFSSAPGVGIVASITIPPILYIPYLGLPHKSVIDIALKRTSDVCIGIAAAVIAAELIFPTHAKTLFLTSLASALDDVTAIYLSMSRELLSTGDYNYDRTSSERIERSIELTLGRCNAHLTALKVEVTLIHKPIRIYRRVIQSVQKLSDLLVSIAVIREKIPRQATVTRVLQQRKDLVSAILVHLFACSHAFRSRLPLPQFLPSPRDAVRSWEAKALEGLLAPEDRDLGEIALVRNSEGNTSGPLHRDAAFLYAFAEAQALEEVIKVVEEITSLTRALFGSSTFFQDQRDDRNRSPVSRT